MSLHNWMSSNDELETFGLMTFESGADSAGTTENSSIDDDDDEMPPSQG